VTPDGWPDVWPGNESTDPAVIKKRVDYTELRRKVHALEERCVELAHCRVMLEKMLQQVKQIDANSLVDVLPTTKSTVAKVITLNDERGSELAALIKNNTTLRKRVRERLADNGQLSAVSRNPLMAIQKRLRLAGAARERSVVTNNEAVDDDNDAVVTSAPIRAGKSAAVAPVRSAPVRGSPVRSSPRARRLSTNTNQ